MSVNVVNGITQFETNEYMPDYEIDTPKKSIIFLS